MKNILSKKIIVNIESKELMMPWKWYDAPVVKIEDYTSNVKRFWIDLKEQEFDFEPGQFVTLDLPISDKRLKRWRSYSIASKQDELPMIELCVVKLEGGAATEHLFQETKVGDTFRFKGPSGAFVVPQNPDFDVVLICTGTGVAPFRPMIHDLLNVQKTERKVHLIFGTRTEEGILYREEWEKLAKEHDNFTFSACLSRQENWDGTKGYVHSVYMNVYSEPREDVVFYICGWSQMIDEAVANLLLKLKYDKSQIIYELYG